MADSEFESGKEQGVILAEIKGINGRLDSIDQSFREFKTGIGETVGTIKTDVVVLKIKVSSISKVLWWGLGISGTAIVGAVYKLILVK